MNTAWITSETLRVSTLGPLHLGCGEDYLPGSYVMDEHFLYAFSEASLPRALDAQGMKELSAAALAEGEQALRRLQTLVARHREKLIPLATHRVPVTSAIYQHYDSRIGQVAHREQGGRNVINALQIQRTARVPTSQRVLLTGSAVKGAIRTAVLERLNAGHALSRELQQERPGIHRFDRLQKQLLDYGRVDEDPFRLLKVSDACYEHADALLPTEIRVAVSVKRKPSKHGAATINTRLECIAPWRSRCFEMTINLHDRTLAESDQRRKGAAGQPFVLPRDLHAFYRDCNAYYLPKLRRELDELGEHGYFEPERDARPWVKDLRALLDGELGRALHAGRAFLLRLGKHSGAEDKTLEGLRAISIRGKKGERPQIRDRTTEVRLASERDNATRGLLAFGWVILECSGTELPETHAFLRRMAEPAYAQRERVQELDLQAATERARLAAETLEREARQQEEAERERKEQERLASLTGNGRVVEGLRVRMAAGEGKGQGAGCGLAGELGSIIDSAADWSAEERSALLQLATELYRHLDIDPKRNDKARKRLNSLR